MAMKPLPFGQLPARVFLRMGHVVASRPRLLLRAHLVSRPLRPYLPRTMPRARQVHLSTILLPPAVFVGLLGALWTWKCLMMVVFQNKIIYMPGLPPNARRETIAEYAGQCGGVQWHEQRIRAADGTDLALCVASLTTPARAGKDDNRVSHDDDGQRPPFEVPVYVLYFQGNASSIPPRLPDISWVLRDLARRKPPKGFRYTYTIACLSYRGYWTSRGRPSEQGINRDTEAAAQWVAEQSTQGGQAGSQKTDPVVILWGQSIGAGFATNLAVSHAFPSSLKLDALVLETPFLSVRAMLETLYPQKWLPYRYLWPFLRNHLDNWSNLELLAEGGTSKASTSPTVTLVEAGRDELVPAHHGAKLYEHCIGLGVPVGRTIVGGAYHNEASFRPVGKGAIASAIEAEAHKRIGFRPSNET